MYLSPHYWLLECFMYLLCWTILQGETMAWMFPGGMKIQIVHCLLLKLSFYHYSTKFGFVFPSKLKNNRKGRYHYRNFILCNTKNAKYDWDNISICKSLKNNQSLLKFLWTKTLFLHFKCNSGFRQNKVFDVSYLFLI